MKNKKKIIICTAAAALLLITAGVLIYINSPRYIIKNTVMWYEKDFTLPLFCQKIKFKYNRENGNYTGKFQISERDAYRLWEKLDADERQNLEHKLNSIRGTVEGQIPANAESIRKGEYLMWCTDQSLCWFPIELSVGEENFKLVQIPKDQIYFYVESGDVNTIINGSGGNSSYSFLTGFHGKIDPINVSTTIQDTRCIQLYYKENGADNRFDLAFEDLNYLRRLLPG